jgi:inosose dehydratase
MKVGVFNLIDAFSGVEHQLERIRDMGFECADVTDSHSGGSMGACAGFVASTSLESNPKETLRLFQKYGLEISTVCAHGWLLDPASPARFGTNEIMKAVRFASDIGVKYVVTSEDEPYRHEWVEKLDYRQRLTVIADKLYEPLKLAEDYGVMILMEPHGPISDSIQGMKDLIAMLDCPALGVNMDTGNSWLGGTDPVEMARELKPYIKHVHWKDLGEKWVPLRGKLHGCGFADIAIGDGVIDIKGVCDVLRDLDIPHSTLEIVGNDDILLRSVKFLKSQGMG